VQFGLYIAEEENSVPTNIADQSRVVLAVSPNEIVAGRMTNARGLERV
jgi:hypothetical protein